MYLGDEEVLANFRGGSFTLVGSHKRQVGETCIVEENVKRRSGPEWQRDVPSQCSRMPQCRQK